MAKLLSDTLPDGARQNQFEGGERQATCICGQRFARASHIILDCRHSEMLDLRKDWALID